MTGWWQESLAVAVAAVFVLAGVSKMAVPRRLTSTLQGLGLKALAQLWIVRLLGVVELAVAYGFTAKRDWWAAAGVVGLALAFAGAGVLAVRRGADVDCNCLGVGRTRLGGKQVGMLPLWVLVALLPLSAQYAGAAAERRMLSWAVALVVAASIRLVPAVAVLRTVSGRRAAMGMSR
jgi:uncharacterized protein YjeT (DUF2065 family)